jgi:DNA invertase Pin-like site-specific DNA recombinase
MSESGKITASHLSRTAVIYVRQSTLVQVERNTESTARQYDLVHRARQLGWPRGRSGSSTATWACPGR